MRSVLAIGLVSALLAAPLASAQPSTDVARRVEQLGDTRWSVREAAVRALVRVGLPATPAVAAAARRRTGEVAVRARRVLAAIVRAALSRMGDEEPLEPPPGSPVDERFGGEADTPTGRELVRLGRLLVRPLALQLTDEDLGGVAFDVLYRIGRGEAGALAAALDGDDVGRRVALVRVLVALGPRAAAAVPALLRATRDSARPASEPSWCGHDGPPRSVGHRATRALSAIGTPAAVAGLVHVLRHGQPGLRRLAADLLAHHEGPEAVFDGLARAALHDPDTRVREAAVMTLIQHDRTRVWVGRDLCAPSRRTRAAAARLLDRLLVDWAAAVGALASPLRRGDPAARLDALARAARQRFPLAALLDAIGPCLDHPRGAVRAEAARTLAALTLTGARALVRRARANAAERARQARAAAEQAAAERARAARSEDAPAGPIAVTYVALFSDWIPLDTAALQRALAHLTRAAAALDPAVVGPAVAALRALPMVEAAVDAPLAAALRAGRAAAGD